MYRPRLRGQALRLGLLVTLVVLVLSVCGGGDGGSAQEEAKARHLPDDPQKLSPGEYRSEEFKPSFSLTVGKGWHNVPLEMSDRLAIQRGGEEEGPTLGFRNLQKVYEYTKNGTTSAVVKAPKDMVGWF
jgi:hypothetical protein